MDGEPLGPDGDGHRRSGGLVRRQAQAVPVGQHHLVGAGHRGLQEVGLSDEVGHEPGGGAFVDGLGGVDLEEASVVHDADAVAHGDRLLLVVGDVHERDADLALEVLELVLHLVAELQGEGAEGCVEQQHLGTVHERPGQGNPLLLAPGQLGGLAVGHGTHLDQVDGPVDEAPAFGPGDPAHLEAEADVVGHRHVGEQGVALEHGVDGPLVGRAEAHLLAVDADGPRRREFQAGHHAQGGGLAAARRAEQGEELAVGDGEVDVVHRGDLGARTVAEALDHPGQLDGRTRRSWPVHGSVHRPVLPSTSPNSPEDPLAHRARRNYPPDRAAHY